MGVNKEGAGMTLLELLVEYAKKPKKAIARHLAIKRAREEARRLADEYFITLAISGNDLDRLSAKMDEWNYAKKKLKELTNG